MILENFMYFNDEFNEKQNFRNCTKDVEKWSSKFPNSSIPAERWLWKESFHWAQIQEQGLWGDWDSEQNNLDHEGKQNQTLFQAQI